MPMRHSILREAIRGIARAQAFGRSQAGVAAVEFALVLPVMIVMYLGMTEVTVGVNTDRKLTLLSRSLADLTSRANTISPAEMSNIFAASTAVMQPYDGSKVKMAVTSVLVTPGPNSTTVGTVDWSCAQGTGATKRGTGTNYPVPAGFTTATSFILVETAMTYVPMFGGRFLGGTSSINLGETTPWPVRNGGQVSWQGTAC